MSDRDPPLGDGAYDVVVVDAGEPRAGAAVPVELLVVAGPQKGQVVPLRAAGLGSDPLDLIGLPGTLEVRDGVPRLTVERGD